GHPNNLFTTYYENGKVASTTMFKKGVIKGEVLKFYPSGSKSQIVSHDKQGYPLLDKEFHEDGTLKKSIVFVNGQENGEAISYHENGQISEVIPYIKGKLSGTYQRFDENGNLTMER